MRFRKQTPCKADRPGGAEGIQSVKAAPKRPELKSPDNHCLEYSRAKKERDSKIRKRSHPAGCCIPMVLHQCGP